jgi:hypothetical protein
VWETRNVVFTCSSGLSEPRAALSPQIPSEIESQVSPVAVPGPGPDPGRFVRPLPLVLHFAVRLFRSARVRIQRSSFHTPPRAARPYIRSERHKTSESETSINHIHVHAHVHAIEKSKR